MKFSDLKKKLGSATIHRSDEKSANSIREIEDKYLPGIHGALNEGSPSAHNYWTQAWGNWSKAF